MTKRTALLATVVLVAGCVTDAEPELGATVDAVVTTNGEALNGVRLNGVRLNGVRLNGVRLNGVRLNGVRLNGVRLNGVSLVGSQLTSIEGDTPLAEDDLIGTRWDGALSDGSVLPIQIDAISHGTGTDADVTMYQVSYQTTDGWIDLCGLDAAGAPVSAIAVPGTWNYDEGVPGGGAYERASGDFTFACRGVAIAKCVEMGYKPWLGFAAYLATCTRALRGDFCGDGRPYTVDGTTINLYDKASIELDTQKLGARGRVEPERRRVHLGRAPDPLLPDGPDSSDLSRNAARQDLSWLSFDLEDSDGAASDSVAYA